MPSNRMKSFLEAIAKNRNGWIVCMGGIVLNLNKNGPSVAFGIFIAEFRRIYKRPLAELDWIAVLVSCLTNLLTPLPTLIIRRMGRKGYAVCSLVGTVLQTTSCLVSSLVDCIPWLFLTFSVLFGLGSSFVLISSSLIICDFFPTEHRCHVLATSLYQCGYPLGILIYAPFFACLVAATSWKITFRIVACVLFASGIICSLLLLLKNPRSEDLNKKATSDLKKTNVEEGNEHIEEDLDRNKIINSKWLDVIKTPERICWLLGLALTYASQAIAVFNLPHYMEDKGYNKLESSATLTFVSLFEFLSYVVAASVGNLLKGKLIYSNILSSLAFAMLFFIWANIDTAYNCVMVFSSLLGVCLGITFTFMYAGSGEAMTMDIDIAWTVSCFVSGIGSLAGPILWGCVYDFTHSYAPVFISVGVVCSINCLLFAAIPLIKHFRFKKKP